MYITFQLCLKEEREGGLKKGEKKGEGGRNNLRKKDYPGLSEEDRRGRGNHALSELG